MAVPVRAGFVINFETEPALPTQPSTFAAAGAMQTYTKAGFYSISGGVVLGNPPFLAAFAAQGSPPNLYGTADFADPSLQSTIRLNLSAPGVTSVSGVLFNGQNFAETYTLNAFSGVMPVASQTFTAVQPNSLASFRNFSLSSLTLPITQVTVTTPDAGISGWDFFVDTLSVQQQASVVPAPSSFVLLATGSGLSLLAYGCRRPRRALPGYTWHHAGKRRSSCFCLRT
jgi:hypothetical protein